MSSGSSFCNISVSTRGFRRHSSTRTPNRVNPCPKIFGTSSTTISTTTIDDLPTYLGTRPAGVDDGGFTLT